MEDKDKNRIFTELRSGNRTIHYKKNPCTRKNRSALVTRNVDLVSCLFCAKKMAVKPNKSFFVQNIDNLSLIENQKEILVELKSLVEVDRLIN